MGTEAQIGVAADYSSIPAELRQPSKWLQYYLSPDPKKPTKKPRKHPEVTYGTPEDRAANLRPLDYLIENRTLSRKGGGYQRLVDKEDGFVYVDLDHVRDSESGEVQPWAQEIIESLDSYTEISASGTGFHIVCRGVLAEDHDQSAKGDPVEIYSGNRENKLIAMTGALYDWRFSAIESRQEQLDDLLRRAKCGEFTSGQQAEVETEEPEEEIAAEEPLPEFPKLTGSLHDLASALCPDLPYCHKFTTALTIMGAILAGRVHLAGAQHIDPRFYATLVDLKGAGKGGSYTETLGCFADSLDDLHIQNSVDSGPALVKALAFTPRMLLYCDELASGLFEKAKVTGGSRNSLFGDLLTLHDGHAIANDTKGNLELPAKIRNLICADTGEISVKNAHFSLIGCVQPQTFADMWRGTKAAASGLQDRFLLVSSGQEFVPEPQRESDRPAVDQAIARIRKQISRYLPGQGGDEEHISFAAAPLIPYPEELGAQQRDWWESHYTDLGASSRMPALVMRMVLMLAITNDADEVTPELLGQALAFAEYQIALRERLLPPDAMSNVQAFEELIRRAFAKHGERGLSFNQVRRHTNPEKHKLLGGYGPFMKAWQNLLLAGVVRAADKNRKAAIYVYES